MQSKIIYSEVYDFGRLERAAKCLHLPETEETEIRIFNLHNHLIWHSYQEGKDLVADAILSSVLSELLEERNADAEDLPAEFRNLCVEGRR